MSRDAIVGVSDHGGWAVVVTADRKGTLLDRRRVELVDEGLPKIPHHSEGQRLPIEDAVALVERVRASAERCSKLVLDAVEAALPGRIRGIALRECQELPPTTAERITNYRASNVADWVMYRRALAAAAEAHDWPVYWYDSRKVSGIASEALGIENLDDHFAQLRRSIGPPWGQDHRMAMAAAIAVNTDTSQTQPDFESLYHRAFAEHRVRALWNVREIEHPTREETLIITRRLRIEGNLDARRLAEQIEQACRATH